MDRTPYQFNFSVSNVPAWACPVCGEGRLTLSKESLISKQDAESRRGQDHEAWDLDWVRLVFSCVFHCSNQNCKQPVACSGTGWVEVNDYTDDDGDWAQDIEERYKPKFFHPALKLIDFPEKCPQNVVEYLCESFALVYANPGAALNSARTALEALMTALGVNRFSVGKGKKTAIKLHQRIHLLPEKYKDQRDMLLAVKWLGNAGSHDGDKASTADVMLAYEMLEHVLSEIYEEKSKKLKALAAAVNRNKGPAKAKVKKARSRKRAMPAGSANEVPGIQGDSLVPAIPSLDEMPA